MNRRLYRPLRLARRRAILCGTECTFEPCYYCGLPSTDVDHIPPQSKYDFYFSIGFDAFYTVPSCSQCNRWLSARPLLTPESRRAYILRYLADKRYAVWEKWELKELGPNMRREVEAYMRAGALNEIRVAWASGDAPELEDEDTGNRIQLVKEVQEQIRHISIHCAHCNDSFLREYKTQKYCSSLCRSRAWKKPKKAVGS